ncbi:MAG: ATP-binding cassette domain-containing protein [Alteromonadaceae bacterium]|nr:ATP-binding cassette domain-containing protein [Alteromonadaceae bacterium]
MIHFSNLALMRGTKTLFQDASLKLHFNQKVGLVGRNGSGKSSLFAMLQGDLQPEAGDFSIPKDWRIAIVKQETPAVEKAAIEYVLDGDQQFRELQKALVDAESNHDGMLAAELHGKLQDVGAETIYARAASIMAGLGFKEKQAQNLVSEFSGGWRMRLNLAQALICQSDMMLLDEPTNHLDLDAVLWLAKWLVGYQGTLVLISHDRDFLDATVQQILSLEQQTLQLYKGNFTSYEIQKAEKQRLQNIAAEKQMAQVAHLQKFVDRFGAKASKAKQAQSRKKQLEKMVQILPVQQESSFSFEFLPCDKLPNPLVKMEQVAAGYGDAIILEKIQMNLVPGSRIGLLGHNGAGKSTLVKTLSGDLPAVNGVYESSQGLNVGYFSQHQLEHLHLSSSPLEHLRTLDPQAKEQFLRDFLGGFGFHGDQALEPVEPMSGGEKARLALALVVYQRPNLLLLDEPTNHLDLTSRTALTLALQEYPGAIILVSHDRFLLEAVCDDFYLVAERTVTPFDGDLNDYQKLILAGNKNAQEGAKQNTGTDKVQRKDIKRLEAQFRQSIQPLKKKLSSVESKLEKEQTLANELESKLADPELYAASQKDQLKTLLSTQATNKQALEELEHEWMELEEAIEQRRVEFEEELKGTAG